MNNNTAMIPKLYNKLSAFCEENEMPEIPMNIHYISGEYVKGECGEILEKEQIREDFEDNQESISEWEDFDEYWEDMTAMGGYFVQCVNCFFGVTLDGMTMEDENCGSARFDDIEEALEEAVYRAEKNAKYDWVSGEWKQPEIAIECFFCG